jgi:transcriptional regulator with XRE-family HTH domain
MLAVKIREARKSLNMNQGQFAEKLGVSQSAVSNWEHGKDKPSTAILLLLSELIDDRYFISREAVFGKSKPMPKAKPLPPNPLTFKREMLNRLDGIEKKLEQLLHQKKAGTR